MAEPQVRYCTTSDGVSIAWYAMGEGVPLVCASWVLFSSLRVTFPFREFARSGSGFGRGMRLVRYDARGSGLSDRASVDSSIKARLADLDAVVDKNGLRRFALMGALHAAPTAIAYAAQNPERISHLILVWPWVDGKALRELLAPFDSLRASADADYERFTKLMAAHNTRFADRAVVEATARFYRESMHLDAIREFTETLSSINVEADLDKVTAPTLVIFREPSFTDVPFEWAARIAAAIPHAELVRISGEEGARWGEEENTAIERFLGIEPTPPPTPPSAAIAAEVRAAGALQTILFTDIEANTELLQRVGDAAWRAILRDHERVTRTLLAEHGGTEIKTIGDAFMTSFASASAAIACAIALQRAFPADAGAGGPPLRLRIGINAGEPIVEDDPSGRGDLYGTSVTMASRIQGLARGGEILVSDVVRQLVAGKGFLFEDRGDAVLRGFDDPVRIFAVRTG